MNEYELILLFLSLRCIDEGSPLFTVRDIAYAIQKRIDKGKMDAVWEVLLKEDGALRQVFDEQFADSTDHIS